MSLPMTTPLDVAVLGATGLAGEAFLAALGDSPLEIANLQAFGGAARSPRVDAVTFRGASYPVESAARLVDARPAVVVSCLPSKAANALLPGLARRGCFVVDVGNAAAGALDAPLVWPIALDGLPDAALTAGAARIPSPIGAALASLLAPVPSSARPSRIVGAAMLPATRAGRAACDELGQQAIASFTQTDPQRLHWPEGLAFDLLPEDTPEEEWSLAERLAADEVAAIARLDAAHVAVSVGTVPLFSGMTLALTFGGSDVEGLAAAWRGADGLSEITRLERLRPRARVGKSAVAWGRLRPDPAGDGAHVWVVADPLALVASGAVTLLQRLVEARAVGGST